MQHSYEQTMSVKPSSQTGVEVEESSFINTNNQSFEQEPVGLYAAVRLKNLTKVTTNKQTTHNLTL